VRVFDYAGELGPVFGLVGTLFAITQLVPGAASAAAVDDPTITTLAAVGTAVLSSLYGVLTAHLVCIPVAHAIERKGEREEDARSRLAEWLACEIAAVTARRASVTRLHEVGLAEVPRLREAEAGRAR
jgi:chemotaxis protein MotA